MKEIPIGGTDLVAVVDDSDYETLSVYKWYLGQSGSRKVTYARAHVGNRNVSMHRLMFGDTGKLEIDHINGNGLDNRRSNLRLVTHQQNLFHRGKQKNNRSSQYKGVTYKDGNFYAQIRLNGKNHRIGPFSNEHDAAIEYDHKAREFFGEYAYTNF